MPPTNRRYTSASKPGPRPSSARPRRKKRKNNPTARSFWIVIVALAVFVLAYNYTNGDLQLPFNEGTVYEPTVDVPVEGEIRVYFLDIGQGDSILLQTDDNAVLIDAGEYSTRGALLSYLRDAGVQTLDYIVATHPHTDHMGAMVPILENFTVKEAVLTDVPGDTASYESFLELLDEQKIPVTVPSVGDVITAGIIKLEVIAPLDDYSDDLNNASLVLRMLHGDTAFLFTGDAEWPSERDMLDAGSNVRANILKVGHHGSDTSSSDEFLDAVRPTVAVISCGRHNSYGHPHEGLLERLAARDIMVFRTDEKGTIIMSTDGQKVQLLSGE